jgi:hypothetical protein
MGNIGHLVGTRFGDSSDTVLGYLGGGSETSDRANLKALSSSLYQENTRDLIDTYRNVINDIDNGDEAPSPMYRMARVMHDELMRRGVNMDIFNPYRFETEEELNNAIENEIRNNPDQLYGEDLNSFQERYEVPFVYPQDSHLQPPPLPSNFTLPIPRGFAPSHLRIANEATPAQLQARFGENLNNLSRDEIAALAFANYRLSSRGNGGNPHLTQEQVRQHGDELRRLEHWLHVHGHRPRINEMAFHVANNNMQQRLRLAEMRNHRDLAEIRNATFTPRELYEQFRTNTNDPYFTPETIHHTPNLYPLPTTNIIHGETAAQRSERLRQFNQWRALGGISPLPAPPPPRPQGRLPSLLGGMLLPQGAPVGRRGARGRRHPSVLADIFPAAPEAPAPAAAPPPHRTARTGRNRVRPAGRVMGLPVHRRAVGTGRRPPSGL